MGGWLDRLGKRPSLGAMTDNRIILKIRILGRAIILVIVKLTPATICEMTSIS